MNDAGAGDAADPSEERRRRLRDSVSRIALDLAATRGLSAVTVDEIARAANISRRTFFNYFPSKAAAVIPYSLPVSRSATRELLYDRSLPTMEAVSRFLWTNVSEVEARRPDDFSQWHTVLRTDPELRPAVHTLLDQLEHRVSILVAIRLSDTDRPGDRSAWRSTDPPPATPEAAAIAAAAVAALRVAIDRWQVGDTSESLQSLIRQAFAAISVGCDDAEDPR